MSANFAVAQRPRINFKSGGRKARTFTLKDQIKDDSDEQNLFETILQYPNKGIGFKVRLPYWKKGKYFVITDVKLESKFNKQEVFGDLFENNRKVSYTPLKIKNAESAYGWEYELGKEDVKMDNGLIYTMSCMMPFYIQQTTALRQ